MSSEVRQLVHDAEAGDEQCWNRLVDQFSGLVWHVISGFRLPRAAGEDIFQTTWLRSMEHIGRIRKPEAFGSWLASTARNECLRAVHHRQREQLHADPGLMQVDADASVDGATIENARDTLLWDAFQRLSPKCQQLLSVFLDEPGLPYEQVGELLDMPIGSIGPTRSRCLQRLRSTSEIVQLKRDS